MAAPGPPQARGTASAPARGLMTPLGDRAGRVRQGRPKRARAAGLAEEQGRPSPAAARGVRGPERVPSRRPHPLTLCPASQAAQRPAGLLAGGKSCPSPSQSAPPSLGSARPLEQEAGGSVGTMVSEGAAALRHGGWSHTAAPV